MVRASVSDTSYQHHYSAARVNLTSKLAEGAKNCSIDLRVLLSHGYLQPPTIDASDLQAPKALWHEDTRGQRGNQHSDFRGGPPQPQYYANGRPVGPVSQAGFRMLNHSLPGQGHAPQMVRFLADVHARKMSLLFDYAEDIADQSIYVKVVFFVIIFR